MTAEATRQPSKLILAMLVLLSGVLNIGSSLLLLGNSFVAASSGIPMWAIYLNLVLGVVQIIATVLIFMGQRIGLLLATVAYVVSIIVSIIGVVTGQTIISIIPGVVLAILALILLFRSLTREA